MSLKISPKATATVVCAAIFAIIAIVIVVVRVMAKPSPVPAATDIHMGGGWTAHIGSVESLNQLDSSFGSQPETTSERGRTVYGGVPMHRDFYIVSDDPASIAADWDKIGYVLALTVENTQAVEQTPEFKALRVESKLRIGVLFHEIVGHGSDCLSRAYPLKTISILWPGLVITDPKQLTATPINPWRMLYANWPDDIGQHSSWVNIPNEQYLMSKAQANY